VSLRALQLRLGLGACAVALFLVFIAIPTWVSSPSNVSNIVLSPTFWPYTLAALTGIAGLGLMLSSRAVSADRTMHDDDQIDGNPWLRLLVLAVIMVLTMLLLPRLGMVWTSMPVFAVIALMFKTQHRITALVCAVLIPLLLYAFFAHVAGVAIPQGEFVRLP
jgi:cell division protein FtsW (lipid II flippase)